ncbi:uncharacterized protein LOC105180800 isoform X1 [Harpegnathos saltator]|uniref:uncharacterized protein LOC105180800 isoform X1 n=1 Tax=Harpegnathos saltator TaxID=610380 RepID=UPI000948F1DC|nr:uncharacterized protein LOC105180800 isoform X1 [Harpegnathos saltator]
MTDFEWAIGLNRIMLKTVGLWPPDTRDTRENIRAKIRLTYNLITLLFILTIPSLIALIRVWGDMILMIENMMYSIPLLTTVFKVCIIWYKQEDLLPLIDMIERDWTKPKMKEERDVMLRRAKIIRAIATCGWIVTSFTIIFTFGLPSVGMTIRHVTNLTDPGKPLPIQSYYLHDVSKSPQFELTLLAQLLTLITTGFSYTGIDHFLGLLVLHVCGQLENLCLRLTHMKMYSDFDAALIYNIKDHIRLIRSVEIIDDTFNVMLLFLVLYLGIVFCLQGFLLINVVNQTGQLSYVHVGWYATAIVYISLHMCLYCVVGEVLVTQITYKSHFLSLKKYITPHTNIHGII